MAKDPRKKAKAKAKVKTKKLKKSAELDLDIESLRKIVLNKDSSESAVVQMNRAFLGSTLEAVKIAEKAYREKPHAHNSYAYNGLINQVREIAADLRQYETVEENRAAQVTDIVHALMKRFGFQVIQQINLIKAEALLTKSTKTIKLCEAAGHSIAEYTNEITNSMIEELSKS